MAIVALDVGAHEGQTLEAMLDPRFGIDRIYAFEPATTAADVVARFSDPRLTLERIGLGARSEVVELHAAGAQGASIYADKGTAGASETVRLVDVAEWFEANIGVDDEVYLKLNCEGAEADVLERLVDSGHAERVKAALITFDIRKIPSQAHREETVRRRLADAGVEYEVLEDVDPTLDMRAGVRRLLRPTTRPAGWGERVRYRLGFHLPRRRQLAFAARAVLPRPVFLELARRLPR